MGEQSINAEMIDLVEDEDNGNGFLFLTPPSDKGTTERNAISVEEYSHDRDLHLAILAALSKIKPEIPDLIDLSGHGDDEEEDDPRILQLTPKSKTLERGQCSRSNDGRGQTTFVCEICVEQRPRSESFRIKGCSHSYCGDCISKYVAAKLQDNILTIKCPVSGCNGALEPEYCRPILPKEVFNRWGDALCEAVILAGQRLYCPYNGCSALLVVDEAEVRESECPHCNRLFCAKCGVKWHAEISCEEFQRPLEHQREREEAMLTKLAETKRWKRCPSCKIYVEKSWGCLYIKCRCGFAFCYNCGTPLGYQFLFHYVTTVWDSDRRELCDGPSARVHVSRHLCSLGDSDQHTRSLTLGISEYLVFQMCNF